MRLLCNYVWKTINLFAFDRNRNFVVMPSSIKLSIGHKNLWKIYIDTPSIKTSAVFQQTMSSSDANNLWPLIYLMLSAISLDFMDNSILWQLTLFSIENMCWKINFKNFPQTMQFNCIEIVANNYVAKHLGIHTPRATVLIIRIVPCSGVWCCYESVVQNGIKMIYMKWKLFTFACEIYLNSNKWKFTFVLCFGLASFCVRLFILPFGICVTNLCANIFEEQYVPSEAMVSYDGKGESVEISLT